MACAPCRANASSKCCEPLGQIRRPTRFRAVADPGRYVSAYAKCVDDYFWLARRGDAASVQRTPAGAARTCKNDWRKYVSSRVMPLGANGPEYRKTQVWKLRDGSCEQTVCTPEGCEATPIECPSYCTEFGECVKPALTGGAVVIALGVTAAAAYFLTR